MMCEYKMYTLKSLIAFTKANTYFSIMLYLSVASLKDLLKNSMGYSYPWSFFCNKTAAIVCYKAKETNIKYFWKSGLIRIGVLVRAFLMASKGCLASTVYLNAEYFLNMLFSSLINSAKFEINLLRKFILPKIHYNYLMLLGWVMVNIASILVGSILIPYLDIICPKSLPYSKPKSVFLGFKGIPNFLHLVKTLLLWSRCSFLDLERLWCHLGKQLGSHGFI